MEERKQQTTRFVLVFLCIVFRKAVYPHTNKYSPTLTSRTSKDISYTFSFAVVLLPLYISFVAKSNKFEFLTIWYQIYKKVFIALKPNKKKNETRNPEPNKNIRFSANSFRKKVLLGGKVDFYSYHDYDNDDN